MKVSKLQVAAGAISYLLAGGNIIEGLTNQDPMSTVAGVVWACAGTLGVAGAIKEAENQTKEKRKTR